MNSITQQLQQHTERKPMLRVLRMKQLVEKLGISRSAIYEKINPNSPRYDETFPKSIDLGTRAKGWFEVDIDEWLLNRIK